VESPAEAAEVARNHWELGGAGLLLARPPDESVDDAEQLFEEALDEAEAEGIRGQAVTPFVLARVHEQSGGRTAEANKALVLGNARLAAQVATS
jgi:pseudouridine-5'-phosphate glycosidase